VGLHEDERVCKEALTKARRDALFGPTQQQPKQSRETDAGCTACAGTGGSGGAPDGSAVSGVRVTVVAGASRSSIESRLSVDRRRVGLTRLAYMPSVDGRGTVLSAVEEPWGEPGADAAAAGAAAAAAAAAAAGAGFGLGFAAGLFAAGGAGGRSACSDGWTCGTAWCSSTGGSWRATYHGESSLKLVDGSWRWNLRRLRRAKAAGQTSKINV
jgi:hypothetical protein